MDVFFRPVAEAGALFGAEGADDFSRGSHDHRAGGDFCARGDDGAGGDEALVADRCAVENDRTKRRYTLLAERLAQAL